jgi:subtilisin family serine protease
MTGFAMPYPSMSPIRSAVPKRRLRCVTACAFAVIVISVALPHSVGAAPLHATMSPHSVVDRIAVEVEEAGFRRGARARRHGARRGPRHHGRRPGKNSPGEDIDKPQDRPGRDRPGKTDHATQDRRPRGPVCIDGRVRTGRCFCRSGQTRHRIGLTAFACSRPGTPVARPPALTPPSVPAGAGSDRPTQAQVAQAGIPQYVPDEIMVAMAPLVSPAVDDAVARDHRLELLNRRSIGLLDIRLVRYRITDGRTVPAVLAALLPDPRVAAPQPNYYYRQQASPLASAAGELQYALARTEIPAARSIAAGRGTLVAVIDSGIDDSHPDLDGAVVDTLDAAGDTTGIPDGHGTAIAGIIGSRGIVQGVAPEARLLSVRVFEPATGDRLSIATTANVLRGIDWAVARQARIINMSFTGPRDPLMEAGLSSAHGRGAIMVAAAGNGGDTAPPAYPAGYPEVIAVTATDFADRLYPAANRGGYITIAAPGVDVLAPTIDHAHALHSGTSFAAALVSGIVALLVERAPSLSAAAARRALLAGANDLGPPGRDDLFGAGRADALASLRLVVPLAVAR